MFWGISGVLMGSALPWVDDLYSEYFPEDEGQNVVDSGSEEEGEDEGFAARWTPVVRSVGAFVGIAFAIVSSSPSGSRVRPQNILREDKMLTKNSANYHGPPRSKSPLPSPS